MYDKLKSEEVRAYWWLIYCKCRQIQKNFEKRTGKDKEELITEMEAMNEPCGCTKEIMKEIIWSYLKECRYEGRILVGEDGENPRIKINSVWLWAYFGYHFLNSKVFSLYRAKPQGETTFTPNEKLEFYYRLSTFFLQLLNEIRIESNERDASKKKTNEEQTGEKNKSILRLEELEGITYVQFARSLIFLISEYCHLDVSMSRVFDVEDVLHKTIFSDAYLYLTKECYRDHMFHVIDVCLLGFFLLNCYFQNKKLPFLRIFSKKQSLLSLFSKIIHGRSTGGMDNIMQNWFLAALFHDVGYSLKAEEQSREDYKEKIGEEDFHIEEWQKVMEIEKLNIHRRNLAELERRKAQYGVNFPLYILNQIEEEKEEIHQLETKLESWNMGKIPASLAKQPPEDDEKEKDQSEDHGVRSYEYVKKVIESLPGDNQKLLNQFKPALEAIRKHNLMAEKIRFSEEPLSFLLVLCDELQEWGRAKVEMKELREVMISKIIFHDTDVLPTNSLLEYLFMSVELNEEKKCGIFHGNHLDFYLFYKDASKENFEPLAIWLSKSYNFQRLDLPKDKLQINVTLRNPVCEDLLQSDTSQLYERNLLRDFMRDQRKWRELHDWFENNEQIKWKVEDDPGSDKKIEYLIMNLNKFAEKQVLHDDPEHIIKELIQWRQDFIKGKRRRL